MSAGGASCLGDQSGLTKPSRREGALRAAPRPGPEPATSRNARAVSERLIRRGAVSDRTAPKQRNRSQPRHRRPGGPPPEPTRRARFQPPLIFRPTERFNPFRQRRIFFRAIPPGFGRGKSVLHRSEAVSHSVVPPPCTACKPIGRQEVSASQAWLDRSEWVSAWLAAPPAPHPRVSLLVLNSQAHASTGSAGKTRPPTRRATTP